MRTRQAVTSLFLRARLVLLAFLVAVTAEAATYQPVAEIVVTTGTYDERSLRGVAEKDGYAYVTARAGRLYVFDIRDLPSKTEYTTYGDPIVAFNAPGYGLLRNGNILYACGAEPGTGAVIVVYSIQDPRLPVLQTRLFPPPGTTFVAGMSLGQGFLLAYGNNGLLVYSLADAASPHLMSRLYLPGRYVWSAVLYGRYIYAGDFAFTSSPTDFALENATDFVLRVVSFANPSQLSTVRTVALGDATLFPFHLRIQSGYLIGGDLRLGLWSLASLDRPLLLSDINFEARVLGLNGADIIGNGVVARVAGEALEQVGTFPTTDYQLDGFPFDMVVSPTYIYIAQSLKVEIATVTAPVGPRVVGRLRVKSGDQVLDLGNLPTPDPTFISLHAVGSSTVLKMRVNSDGTYDSQHVVPGSPTESALPVGTFTAYLDGTLSYRDNIAVDNSDLYGGGCAAPPSNTKTRHSSIARGPDVQVPQGQSSQFDVILPAPIVLLHGIRSCWQGWSSWAGYLNSRGYIVFTPAHHFRGYSKEGEASEVLQQLATDFDSFGCNPQYFVVCHSEGGVAARILSNGATNRCAKTYTMGSPHSGTDFLGAGIYGLDVHHMVTDFNPCHPPFAQAVFAIGGIKPGASDDGIVFPNDSVFEIRIDTGSLSWTLPFTPRHEFNFGHGGLWSEEAITEILESCILADMRGEACTTANALGDAAGKRGQDLVEQASSASQATIFTAQATLAPGEVRDFSVVVSCTDLVGFYMTPLSAIGALSLVDPNGVVISADNYGTYPGAQYSSDDYGQQFFLASPAPGEWHMRVVVGTPPGTVAVGATENSLWHVLVSTDKPDYAAGALSVLNARLTGNLAGLTVTSVVARVRDGSGFVVGSTTLYDDGAHNDGAPGDGIYGNSLSAPALAGHYDLTVDVDGTCQGLAFKRQAAWGLDVRSSASSLTGSFSDVAQDTNSDGVMDTIAETVGLTVATPGEYLVSGNLFDSNGYPISQGVVTVNPGAPGPAQAIVIFDLSKASCSEFAAPFQVKNLLLSDPVNGYSILDSWNPAVATSTYDGTSFGCGTKPDPTPVITAISPNAGFPGDAATINISGSGFLAGASVRFGAYTTGITANVVANGLIVTTWTIPADASPGALDVTVTNTDSHQVTQAGGFSVATDQPPTVAIFYPTSGQPVSGTVVVSASASDDRGIQRVEFFLDGVLAAADTTFPYQFTVDTTTLSSGVHSIQARAYDSISQVGVSAAIRVCVPPPASTPMTLMPDGRATTAALGVGCGTTFSVPMVTGRSYVLDIEIPFDGVGTISMDPAPFVSPKRADGAAFSGGAGIRSGCAPASVTHAIFQPTAEDVAPGPVQIWVVDVAERAFEARFRLVETTQYCARWSVNGYNAFVDLQNTSDCSVGGQVTLLDSSGATVTSMIFSLEPGEATQIPVPTGFSAIFGSANLTHDGPQGCIVGGIYMVNRGAASANYRWPFQEVRAYGATDGK